jgi:alanine racemase
MTFTATAQQPPVELEQPTRLGSIPLRGAWVEIDLRRLRRNFELINADKPPQVRVLSVIKDDGYGHGALAVARVALAAGATYLGVGTLEEGVRLRQQGITAPILLLGQRLPAELPWCVRYNLTCQVQDASIIRALAEAAADAGRRVPVHLKVNTGMNRYGVSWTQAMELVEVVLQQPALELEGLFSHFATAEAADKSFARLQLERFQMVLAQLQARGVRVKYRHFCNSAGLLDLPEAHFDMVRIGLLPLGVYPSTACRRLPGLEPVMSVKARIAAVQQIGPTESVGYGQRYRARSRRRIAVLPIGYGDGFPYLCNQGAALIRGHRAPLVGSVAMDALTVDVTDIPEAQVGDEAVLMGRQGQAEISALELAQLKNSIPYDVLVGWRTRLPRVYLGA